MKVVLTQIKREALSDPTAEVTDKLLDKIMQKYGTTNVLRSETGVERASVLPPHGQMILARLWTTILLNGRRQRPRGACDIIQSYRTYKTWVQKSA